jgi:hypothetical protein
MDIYMNNAEPEISDSISKDILIFNVEIGNLPKLKAEKYLKEISDNLKSVITDRKLLVFPMRNGIKSVIIDSLSLSKPKAPPTW